MNLPYRMLLLCAALVSFTAQAKQELVSLRISNEARGSWLTFSPEGFNNRGEIAGQVSLESPQGSRAAILRNGRVEVLDSVPDATTRNYAKASAINDAGAVAGFSEAGRMPAHPVVWMAGQPPVQIAVPEGNEFASASDINNSGAVTGSFRAAKTVLAFVWSAGKFHRIEPFAPGPKGGSYTHGTKINDRGQAIGTTSAPNGVLPFLWTDGQRKELPVLPEHAGEGGEALAYGINTAGQVVGCSWNKLTKGGTPVIWEADGSVRALFDPRKLGAPFGCANDINVHGAVVGETWGPGRVGVAFVWDAKSGVRNLNDVIDPRSQGWKNLAAAFAINDKGEILGRAEGEEVGDSSTFLMRECGSWRCMLPGRKTLGFAAVGALFLLIGTAWLLGRRKPRRALSWHDTVPSKVR